MSYHSEKEIEMVEMIELERENKRDRLNSSFESAKDDDEKGDGEKSPKMKKKKGSKDAEKRLYHDILAYSKLIIDIGEEIGENDKDILSLIGCYTPVLRECPDQAIEMMIKRSAEWTERKEKFIKAINYMNYGENEKELENNSIENLSEILLTEIINRMSCYCNQCDQYYFIEIKDEKPKIRCMRCKMGRHACDNTNVDKILSEAGLYWFCDECNQQFKLEYLNKLDKNAHFKGFKGAKENNEKEKVKENENEKTKKEDTAKIKDKKTKESEKTSTGDIDIPDEIPKQIINKDQKKEDPVNPLKEKKENCTYWENKGRCRFGEICRLEHRNKCKNIMEIGECKNRDTCVMKHPEVCYNMQYYNYCPRSDADCKFVHPKNIQRKQARRQNTGNYYHNYYQNRYQELDGYDNEDFFGYSQRPWNMEMQMRRGVRTPNMYPQQYQQYQHMYQHAHQHQHPYPPYPYMY